MTPDEKLDDYKAAWVHQIAAVIGPGSKSLTIVQLATLNGLFDPLKKFYADQEREYAASRDL